MLENSFFCLLSNLIPRFKIIQSDFKMVFKLFGNRLRNKKKRKEAPHPFLESGLEASPPSARTSALPSPLGLGPSQQKPSKSRAAHFPPAFLSLPIGPARQRPTFPSFFFVTSSSSRTPYGATKSRLARDLLPPNARKPPL